TTGVYNNKAVEVVADGFTSRAVHYNLSGVNAGAIYLGKAGEAYGPEIVSYTIENNIIDGGAVSISSGTGRTGADANRVIANNVLIDSRIDFNGKANHNGGPAWYSMEVGGAVITGNEFSGDDGSGVYVRRRGDINGTIDFEA